MAQHVTFTVAAAARSTLRPASPWQRGDNENTTACFVQYFPKVSSVRLPHHRPAALDDIAHELTADPAKPWAGGNPHDSTSPTTYSPRA